MPHVIAQLDKEPIGASAPESEAGALVVRRHHLLVRCSHWLNVPILLGLMLSGISIYWASPVYQQETDPLTAGWSTKGGEIEGMCCKISGTSLISCTQ